MEVKIGLAKTQKFAANHCGDACNFVERPRGGVSAILAEGQGSSLAAAQTSRWVVNRAIALLSEGGQDETAVTAVHEELYDMRDKKASCMLTLLSADRESETMMICRNSASPVIVWTEDYETVYDEDTSAIGVHRHIKPFVYELPFSPGMIVVSYTDGIGHAGKKRTGREADLEKILGIVRANKAEDAGFIATSILEYALSLDNEQPSDDMTVVVMGLAENAEGASNIEQMEASCPI